MTRVDWLLRLAASVAIAMSYASAEAADPVSPPSIYRCRDSQDKPYLVQTLTPECVDRGYDEINRDGSLRRHVPRRQTAGEIEHDEKVNADAEAACRQRKIDERADRNLVKRFPDRAHHDGRRQEAINDTAKAVRVSQARLDLLLQEKKRLDDEREFYPKGNLPPLLKLAIDRNDSAREAQTKIITQQRDELQRINKTFDDELAHLQKLWVAPSAPVNCREQALN